MAKARIYGTKTTFVPNSKADRMKNKQLFFHGKDSAESDDRIDRIREKKLRKEKNKMVEEYVKKSREKKRQAFGDCEIKQDCKHYGELCGKSSCKILTNVGTKMPCEVGVCYFYERK